MIEPVSFMEYLDLVSVCPYCKKEARMAFSQAVNTKEIQCVGCAQGFAVDVEAPLMIQVATALERLQEQLRETGCWVEVRPYP